MSQKTMCPNCGSPVETTPGMDTMVEVTFYSTTEYHQHYFCNDACLEEGVEEVL